MKRLGKYAAASVALILLLVLVSCSSGEEEKSVTIGVYGGDWEANIGEAIDSFEKETGIKVNVIAGTDAEWYMKMRAADGSNVPYDLLILQPDTIQRAMSADLLEPIDEEKAPYVAELYNSVQQRFEKDGKDYAAAFSMGQLGIAYAPNAVENVPENWLDLADEEYQGQLGLSSPSYSAGLQFFSGVTQALGGEEGNPEDIDKTFEELKKINKNAVAYPDNPGTIQTLLDRGEISIIPFWDGRIFALQDAGMDIDFVYPKDGAVAAVASWAMMKNAPHEDNAYKLLDYLSSPEVHSMFSEKSYYGMANENTQYSDAIKDKVKVGEDQFASLKWVDYEVSTGKVSEWTNRWSRELGE
ncbi:putative spermidine/putrescine transport system substrate-binding protein [Terribacillus saccharophilus]|uniref:Spermidine/putrescine transport system substrate-binding protein n=1 Tax=Terribacillus saccharophilus TaxID=361277 RepID=A0AAX2EJX8_9BACI|nr:putative spermidine/putrescine transport system substrate-binding protein [Terribacillus saccharophilus]